MYEVDRTASILPLSLQVNHLDEVCIAIPLPLFSICMKLTELPVFATKFAGIPLRRGTYCDSLAFVFSLYEVDRTASFFASKFAGKPLRRGMYCDSLAFVFYLYEVDRIASFCH